MGDNRYYRNRRFHGNKNRNKKREEKIEEAPHSQVQTIPELEKALSDNLSEKTLVASVAIAWNKYAWYAENEAKYQEKEELYSDACNLTDSWGECYYRMIEKLKSFLKIDSDTTFALPEITVYMNKYGFEDDEGYWKIKKSVDDKSN